MFQSFKYSQNERMFFGRVDDENAVWQDREIEFDLPARCVWERARLFFIAM